MSLYSVPYKLRKQFVDETNSADTYVVKSNTKGMVLKGEASGDEIRVEGLAADFQFKADGNKLTLVNGSNSALSITVGLATGGPGVHIAFLDGAVTAHYDALATSKKPILSLTADTESQTVGSKLTPLSSKLIDTFDGPSAVGEWQALLQQGAAESSKLPVMSVEASANHVFENDWLFFTVHGSNFPADTSFDWQIQGIDASRIEGGQLKGKLMLNASGDAFIPVHVLDNHMADMPVALLFEVNNKVLPVVVEDAPLVSLNLIGQTVSTVALGAA